MQCPYCGEMDGIHSWSGSGSCPGAVSERERDAAAAAQINLYANATSALKTQVAIHKALHARAADALESYCADYYGSAELIAKLRKAAE